MSLLGQHTKTRPDDAGIMPSVRESPSGIQPELVRFDTSGHNAPPKAELEFSCLNSSECKNFNF